MDSGGGLMSAEREPAEDTRGTSMRICMVVSLIAPLGGIEAALTTLVRELGRRGCDVRLFALERPEGPNQNVDALARAGVPVWSPPATSLRFTRWAAARRPQIALSLSALTLAPLLPLIAAGAVFRRRSLRSSLGRARWGLQTWFAARLDFERLLYVRLSRELRRMSADVVHVHGWGCGEDPPGALAWLRTRPYTLVYTEHNSPDPLVHPPFDRAPMENADVLIAVSTAGRSGLETVGRTSRPIHVIPYGVDPLPAATCVPGSAVDGFVVTCVARLTPQKGHRDLIAAMARLRQTVPNARLLLAGTGPLGPELQAESERLGLSEQVSFLGLVERADLAELFAQTDVVVLPSYWEGLPVALIEALSAGKPIVASNAGGNPELVRHGENGLLVPIGDPEALARALIRLAADPTERRRMGAAAAEWYRRGDFDPAGIAQQHIDVYRFARGVSKERALRLAAERAEPLRTTPHTSRAERGSAGQSAPTVSVVMPAFNCARYVGAAIDSVLGQSLRDCELIVIDDGSTDGTLDAVRAYAGDPRIRVLRQENSGVASARNRGVSVAASALVAFLDADDFWTVNHLDSMAARMRVAPKAVLAFGSWQYVDEHGTPMPQVVIPFGADPERARKELPWRNAVLPSTVVVRTAAIRRVGGFDTAFQACADWDLWIRLLREGPFVALTQVSTFYRAHAESMTEDGDGMERERLRVNEKHHGVASGPAAGWPRHRRQAVGHTLFSAGLACLRARDVVRGVGKIRQALEVWPELVEDDEFHFELACAFQRRGLRGTGHGLDVQETAQLVRSLHPLPGGRASRGRAAFALAWMALVAHDRRTARYHAFEALRAPGLHRKASALGLLVRSALPHPVSQRLASWRHLRGAMPTRGSRLVGD